MKKFNLLLFISLAATYVFSQGITFEEILPTVNTFEGTRHSSTAFADIDGDSDLDLLITGSNENGVSISKLYNNDGYGNYTEVIETTIEAVKYSSIAFADVDGDNDQDLLITGSRNSLYDCISKLYLNDGTGTFTEVIETPFDGVRNGSIAFADIDGDNDQDVLITGSLSQNPNNISKIYINDGAGNFSEVLDTPFIGVNSSSIDFADIDQDNDLDLLISGTNQNSDNITKLYSNNGTGVFTEVNDIPFDNFEVSCLGFSDIDNDGDQDILITGESDNIETSRFFTNNGNGDFTQLNDTPFIGGSYSYFNFIDIDNDNVEDLIIIEGQGAQYNYETKMYANNGTGFFYEIWGTEFYNATEGSFTIVDIDGDNYLDLMITGNTVNFGAISKLYSNNGIGHFSEISATSFHEVSYSSIAFSDIDSDNDLDLLITGNSFSGSRISKLYINKGNRKFEEELGAPFVGISHTSIAFADIDNDDDQDVLITGSTANFQKISNIYINDGLGNFTEDTDASLKGVYNGSIAFADIDGDSDQDLLITGSGSGGSDEVAYLYTNDGSGNFTEVACPFPGVEAGSVAFADIDGDNDQDLLITGKGENFECISQLYTNDGLGNYTEVLATPFTKVRYSSIAFADIDNDNDQDLLITGYTDSQESHITKLYLNDGLGNYSEDIDNNFQAVSQGSVAFSDIDNDNDLDLLITGQNNSFMYANDGTGKFSKLLGMPFIGVRNSSVAFADIDGDNFQDVFITGNSSLGLVSKLYVNTTPLSIDELITSDENLFVVFPNPTSNKLFVKTNKLKKIEVYNNYGVLIKSTNKREIDLSQETKGVYFIKIITEEEIKTEKIILK